ncbi:head GIN domain-containing protein [Sphingosinicella sp. CPCC 101087]|uniref:head GIN domain-containing protein n=1 Tax=Sphingosinicella sp. CPCC 101087 TaxID=2497754 RepID=UPI00101BEFF6|nr:head GIN domain-containing protein [Sphingosinicella sp. CPCC 101087]
MIRTLLLVAGLVAVSTTSPAVAADRRYAVTDFDRVVVEGPYIVRLTVGGPSTAVASGSQAALDRVAIDVTGRMLRIRRNRHHWGGNPGAQEGTVTVELGTRSLRSARLLGPARLDIDRIEGLKVDLSVEGSGRLRVAQLQADNLSVGLAGAGRVELAGTAEVMNANVQGSGDLEASGLRVETAAITSVTSGAIAVEARRAATVTALGLGTVEIAGTAACTLRGPNSDLVRCGSGRLDQSQHR